MWLPITFCLMKSYSMAPRLFPWNVYPDYSGAEATVENLASCMIDYCLFSRRKNDAKAQAHVVKLRVWRDELTAKVIAGSLPAPLLRSSRTQS